MNYGIASLSVVPVRKEPSHRAELVTQLLFGETYEVVKSQRDWVNVKCSFDDYEGWLHVRQHTHLGEEDFHSAAASDLGVVTGLFGMVSSGGKSKAVAAGSSLPLFDGEAFQIAGKKYKLEGEAVKFGDHVPGLLERVALRFLDAPYLWGGRSPFGIDCSAFVQVVFKCLGVALKRDTVQQVGLGTPVQNIDNALPGDLAFFHDQSGKLIHVGILLSERRLIHGIGRVRMDKIDLGGIASSDATSFPVKLHSIRRVAAPEKIA